MPQLTIYIDDQLKAEIEKVAQSEDRSISYVIRRLVEQGLASIPQKNSTLPLIEENEAKK